MRLGVLKIKERFNMKTYDSAISQLNNYIQYHHEAMKSLQTRYAELLEKYVAVVDKYTHGEERRRLLEE